MLAQTLRQASKLSPMYIPHALANWSFKCDISVGDGDVDTDFSYAETNSD